MPPIPTYQQAFDQTAGVYQPQTNLIQSQIDALPGQEQATLSSLDQAKVNAFRDIGESANAKGVLFSGFTPDQQAQYIGTKYLPAYAEAKTATANAKTSLLSKINDINFQRSQAAQGTVNAAQTAAAKAQAASAKAPKLSAVQVKQDDTSALYGQLQKLAGKDGYIAPDAYAEGLKLWQSAGYTAKEYDALFSGLRNPNNKRYRLATGWGS